MEMGCEVDETDVPGDWSSADEDRDEVPLEAEFVRFSRLLGDLLLHRLRLDDPSDLFDDGFVAAAKASEWAINDDKTLSRRILYI